MFLNLCNPVQSSAIQAIWRDLTQSGAISQEIPSDQGCDGSRLHFLLLYSLRFFSMHVGRATVAYYCTL